MGCFDSVMVPCPECGELTEFQTKAGECLLTEYSFEDAPAALLVDVVNETHRCKNGHRFYLKLIAKPYVIPVKGDYKNEDDC